MFNKMEAFMNEVDTNGDVVVYTCRDGYWLFERNSGFGVWHEQFKEDKDVKMLVPYADLSLDSEGNVYVVDPINVRILANV